jgi:threonine dehydratase
VTGITVQREGDLAWELVEQYRDLLTAEDRTAVFVNLGVGEFPAAIRGILSAIATQRKALTERAAADVQAWIDCYKTDAEFGMLLSRAVGAA